MLRAARAMKPKRLITVFGCGGDRDRAKRPPMGAAVEANSDLFIITDDNPRTEDPDQIMGDIVAGLQKKQSGACQIVHNRREAMQRAVDLATGPDGRRRPSSSSKTSSSAMSRFTARPAARSTFAVWPASASAFATAAQMPLSKAWATMAAST